MSHNPWAKCNVRFTVTDVTLDNWIYLSSFIQSLNSEQVFAAPSPHCPGHIIPRPMFLHSYDSNEEGYADWGNPLLTLHAHEDWVPKFRDIGVYGSKDTLRAWLLAGDR
jgi:hypothetical protein